MHLQVLYDFFFKCRKIKAKQIKLIIGLVRPQVPVLFAYVLVTSLTPLSTGESPWDSQTPLRQLFTQLGRPRPPLKAGGGLQSEPQPARGGAAASLCLRRLFGQEARCGEHPPEWAHCSKGSIKVITAEWQLRLGVPLIWGIAQGVFYLFIYFSLQSVTQRWFGIKKKECSLLHGLDAMLLKQTASIVSTKMISKDAYAHVLLKPVFDKSHFFRENGNKQNIIS